MLSVRRKMSPPSLKKKKKSFNHTEVCTPRTCTLNLLNVHLHVGVCILSLHICLYMMYTYTVAYIERTYTNITYIHLSLHAHCTVTHYATCVRRPWHMRDRKTYSTYTTLYLPDSDIHTYICHVARFYTQSTRITYTHKIARI